MGLFDSEESTSTPLVTPVAERLELERRGTRAHSSGRTPVTFQSVIERLQQMPRRVPADPAAEPGTHLGAVAPVHPAPHTCVAFLGMDLCDARVVTNRAAVPRERQWKLIRLEPYRIERERAGADCRVSGGVFGVGRRGDEGCPSLIR